MNQRKHEIAGKHVIHGQGTILYYTTKWHNKSSDLGGHFNMVSMGLCDCNLKEKLECSSGIYEGRI